MTVSNCVIICSIAKLQETVYLFPNGSFVFGHHVTVYLLIFENERNVAVTIWFPSRMQTENFPGEGVTYLRVPTYYLAKVLTETT